jgi:putative ABC transport system substrate-binding protein
MNRGLSEAGYVEAKNLKIEYRWSGDHNDRLSEFALDLAHRPVAAIIANTGSAALAAQVAAPTTPIVFTIGVDPVEAGLVKSLNRPGGNLTGVTVLSADLVAKRLQLLHQLVPRAVVAMLANPSNTSFFEFDTKQALDAARVLGVRLLIVNAASSSDIEAVFKTLKDRGASALLVSGDAVYTAQRSLIVDLASRHSVPAIYHVREFTTAGGLMSYGPNLSDAFFRAGLYGGRILKGEKAADLPVQQSTKLEMTLNMKAAKALGLTIPETLLATADEVIQ